MIMPIGVSIRPNYHPSGILSHGHARKGNPSPTYMRWFAMIRRCTNKNHKQYKDYGGRGITVCERWLHSFENFLSDMGEVPGKLTLDRKDNAGNYEPSNCKWSTRKEQNRNRRDSIMITYQGKTQCVTVWAEELNLKAATIRNRVRWGVTEPEKLFLQPLKGYDRTGKFSVFKKPSR